MIKNEKAKNIIPIFYACDDCFVKYTIVSIKSIIDNADCNRNYIIHILNADISEQMKNETLKLEKGFAKIKFVDVKAQLDKISLHEVLKY